MFAVFTSEFKVYCSVCIFFLFVAFSLVLTKDDYLGFLLGHHSISHLHRLAMEYFMDNFFKELF